MKIFQTLRKQLAIVGISPSNQSFNERVFFGFSLFGCSVSSQFVYIYVANSLMDSMECICSLSAGIIIFVCFVAVIFRKSTLFESVDNFEKLIDTSTISVFML